VKFYDWKIFLKQFFKLLSSLTTYHHFRADKESPGIVFVKEYWQYPARFLLNNAATSPEKNK
jgi:hypothetical protein